MRVALGDSSYEDVVLFVTHRLFVKQAVMIAGGVHPLTTDGALSKMPDDPRRFVLAISPGIEFAAYGY